jgi:hypothetical protein
VSDDEPDPNGPESTEEPDTDEGAGEDPSGDASGEAGTPTVESLRDRLDEIENRLVDADTESELDELERSIDDLEDDIETAALPEPEDEDETPPAEELEGEANDLREYLEDQRGPYAEDVAEAIDDESSTIASTEWAPEGVDALEDVVADFLSAVEGTIDADLPSSSVDYETDQDDPSVDGETLDGLTGPLDDAGNVVVDADLDPDDDAETIASLLDATDGLSDGVWDATEWTDLEVRERLGRYGFYDVLDHRKDFPPEWHAIKVFEKQDRPEKILIALELMGSEFMEEHCIEALKRMGPEEALDPMLQRAGRRDLGAIEVLGKIGSDEAVDTLVDYVDSDNRELQKVSLRALGEIGSEEAVQPIANLLVAESETVRSNAARTLGLIGDTRAIDPLADVLDDTDETDTVRASAAWALRQIGTERAHDRLESYADDDAHLIKAEAEKVA